jgi:hypothetical protein
MMKTETNITPAPDDSGKYGKDATGGLPMRYFYHVHAVGGEKAEISFFLLINGNNTEITKLTAEMLQNSDEYRQFTEQHNPKRVIADYTVYGTQEDIGSVCASERGEYFRMLIDTKKAEIATSSELDIDYRQKAKKSGGKNGKNRKIKLTPAVIAIGGGAAVFLLIIGAAIGNGLSKPSENSDGNSVQNQVYSEDGMILPAAAEINPEAEQITVAIDRSYSSVPREDLQLKGEVIDGKAAIKLPYFDPADFFTHVPGHTYGFAADPNAKKIQYYGGQSYEFAEDTKLYRVLVKYGGGNGTKDDPYIINYYDQLELMSEESIRGYFRQTADITFPEWANHTPINTVNELKTDPDSEHFEYDGGGFMISGLTAPLFEKVSGAVIQNVNITNAKIESAVYKNYGFIVCEAYNYRYEADGTTYETGETVIRGCTVSHSVLAAKYPETDGQTETVPPAVPTETAAPEFDENGNPIVPAQPPPPYKHGEFAIGGISGIGGQIENCYVADIGISAALENCFLYAGGISGKPANVVNSGVFYVGTAGKIFNAGGIVGSAGGAKMYNAAGEELPVFYGGNIQGCFARQFMGYSENAAGGIAGEGAANMDNSLISNCYASELSLNPGIFEDEGRTKPVRLGVSGGIIGSDSMENYGHLVTNTVSPEGYPVVGDAKKSEYDGTVRLAPAHAFYQSKLQGTGESRPLSEDGILSILNKNTVMPHSPKEIFTGTFIFEDGKNSDETGNLPFPAAISELFAKTAAEEANQNG